MLQDDWARPRKPPHPPQVGTRGSPLPGNPARGRQARITLWLTGSFADLRLDRQVARDPAGLDRAPKAVILGDMAAR